RPRAHGTSEAASARRAVARSRAPHRQTDLRGDQSVERGCRSHRLHRRAERLSCSQARRSRLCPGEQQDHHDRQRLRSPEQRGGADRLSRRRAPQGAERRDWMSYLSDDGPWVFLVMTVILGGGAAFLAGRGLARSWKPFWRLFMYMALLAAAVRFFHYALFDGKLTSVYYYLVTYAILV